MKRATWCVSQKDRLQLIAAARALTDGEYHATIYDLLVADPKVQPFYRLLGFESYADVMVRCDRSKLFDPK